MTHFTAATGRLAAPCLRILALLILALTLATPAGAQPLPVVQLSGPGQMRTHAVGTFTVRLDNGGRVPNGTVELRNRGVLVRSVAVSPNAAGPQNVEVRLVQLPVGEARLSAYFIESTTGRNAASGELAVRVRHHTQFGTARQVTGVQGDVFPFFVHVLSHSDDNVYGAGPAPGGTFVLRAEGPSGLREVARGQLGPGGWVNLALSGVQADDRRIHAEYLGNDRFMPIASTSIASVNVSAATDLPRTHFTLTGPDTASRGDSLQMTVHATSDAEDGNEGRIYWPAHGFGARFVLPGSVVTRYPLAAPLGVHPIYMVVNALGTLPDPPALHVVTVPHVADTATTTTLSVHTNVDDDPRVVEFTVGAQYSSSGRITHGWFSLRRNGVEFARVAPWMAVTIRLRVASLSPGTHRITAHYLGGARYLPSVSAAQTVTISASVPRAAATTTTLSGPTSAIAGRNLTFTARVASDDGTPTGSVSFRRGGTQFATAELSGGSASVTTSALPVGTHQITARYLGTTGFEASTSAAHSVTISAAPVDPVQFSGGGALFGFSDACLPAWPRSQAVRVHYTPSELNGGPPSQVAIVWPTGSEHIALWGDMVASDQFRGGTGRQMWSYFVFYPLRPLVRVAQRQVTQPANGALANAQELVLRLRIQNFSAMPGCVGVLAATLARTP